MGEEAFPVLAPAIVAGRFGLLYLLSSGFWPNWGTIRIQNRWQGFGRQDSNLKMERNGKSLLGKGGSYEKSNSVTDHSLEVCLGAFFIYR